MKIKSVFSRIAFLEFFLMCLSFSAPQFVLADVQPSASGRSERTGAIELLAEIHALDLKASQAIGLNMPTQRLDVEEEDLPAPSEAKAFYVKLVGYFTRADWSITVEYESEPLKRENDGKFTRRIRLTGPVTQLNLIAIGPKGEVEKRSFEIIFEDFERRVQELERLRSRKPFGMSVGVGVSSLSYVAGPVHFSEIGITPKASFTFRNPKWEKWRLTGNGFFTAFAFRPTPYYPDSANHPTLLAPVSVRYLGLNVRAGYKTKIFTNPWSLEIQFGWYYSTMIVSPQYFGYTNANGPQVFPVIERELGKKDMIGAYLKFSPVSSGVGVLAPTTNYEFATGSYYLFPPSKMPFRIAASLDFAYLSLQPIAGAVRSNVTSLTLGGGISF